MSSQKPILMASSIDTATKTYLDKIKLLEDKLSRLNILENPREIRDICVSIIDLKKMLEESKY